MDGAGSKDEGERTKAGQEADKKRTRRTDEEKAAAKADQERRRHARTAMAERNAGMAQSFERRAQRLFGQRADQATTSARKSLRKVLRAAADADVKNDREMARVTEANGEAIDRGTGLTRSKLRTPPIGLLIERHKIGAEERDAADEISTAFMAIAGRSLVRGMSLERVDHSTGTDRLWPMLTARAVGRYTTWANYWTDRSNRYCDPTLEIVISAVIDERPVRIIGEDLGFHHSRVEKGVIFGLRDYAARAGYVRGQLADAWMREAEGLFFMPELTPAARLTIAVTRARTER